MKFYIELDFGHRLDGQDARLIRAKLAERMKEFRPEQIRVESDIDRAFNEELRSVGYPARGSERDE